MINQIVLWSVLVVPWLSVFVMPKSSFKRYMPVAVFASLLVTLYCELADTFSWWVIKQTLFPSFTVFVPFVFGLFFVGTLWIFHFTFHRFWLYLLTNIVIDAVFAFPGNALFQNIGLYQLITHTSWHIFFTFVALSIVIYGYQLWQEKELRDEPGPTAAV